MQITKLPESYDQLIELLKKEGSISFVISRKHKKRFYNCIDRLNKLETLFSKNKLKAQLYGIYVGVLQMFVTHNHKDLHNAVLTYQVAWRHIKNIGGKDVKNNKIEVAFNAHT